MPTDSPTTVVTHYRPEIALIATNTVLLPDEVRVITGGENVGNNAVFKDTAAYLINQRLNEDDDEPVAVTLVFVAGDDANAVVTCAGYVKSWNEEWITKFGGEHLITYHTITFADGVVITDDRLLSVTL